MDRTRERARELGLFKHKSVNREEASRAGFMNVKIKSNPLFETGS